MRQKSRYLQHMMPLVFLLVPFLVIQPATSQGMKGAPEPVSLGPPPLIEGKSDDERWQRFLAIQKRLIGMSYADVIKQLGAGHADKPHLNLSYQLVEVVEPKSPLPPQKSAGIFVYIKLQKDIVQSFTVQGVGWSR